MYIPRSPDYETSNKDYMLYIHDTHRYNVLFFQNGTFYTPRIKIFTNTIYLKNIVRRALSRRPYSLYL